jgi:Na+-driven multidrug efflux pump
MGLNGAAVATLIARAAVFVGALYLLLYRLDLLTFAKARPGELRQSWRDILHVGIPAAGTNVIVPVATAIITAMIAGYGPEAVAGFGVAGRIESLVLVLYYALSAIIGPFVGQNLSAGRHDRILESLRLCTLFCLGSGIVIAILLALAAGSLPTLFSDNPDVVNVTRLYLWLAPAGYGAYGMVMVMNAAFNGVGNPLPGVVVSLSRTLILYVPLALFARQWFDMAGIFAAYAVANAATGLAAYAWARNTVMRAASQQRRVSA